MVLHHAHKARKQPILLNLKRDCQPLTVQCITFTQSKKKNVCTLTSTGQRLIVLSFMTYRWTKTHSKSISNTKTYLYPSCYWLGIWIPNSKINMHSSEYWGNVWQLALYLTAMRPNSAQQVLTTWELSDWTYLRCSQDYQWEITIMMSSNFINVRKHTVNSSPHPPSSIWWERRNSQAFFTSTPAVLKCVKQRFHKSLLV